MKIDPSECFDLIAHGDCTKLKKPSPEIYQWTLEKFQLPPNACVAIEDSPRGLESASGANIKTLVTPSKLTLDEDFGGAHLVLSDLGEPEKPFVAFSGETFGFRYVSFDLLEKICGN